MSYFVGRNKSTFETDQLRTIHLAKQIPGFTRTTNRGQDSNQHTQLLNQELDKFSRCSFLIVLCTVPER